MGIGLTLERKENKKSRLSSTLERTAKRKLRLGFTLDRKANEKLTASIKFQLAGYLTVDVI